MYIYLVHSTMYLVHSKYHMYIVHIQVRGTYYVYPLFERTRLSVESVLYILVLVRGTTYSYLYMYYVHRCIGASYSVGCQLRTACRVKRMCAHAVKCTMCKIVLLHAARLVASRGIVYIQCVPVCTSYEYKVHRSSYLVQVCTI